MDSLILTNFLLIILIILALLNLIINWAGLPPEEQLDVPVCEACGVRHLPGMNTLCPDRWKQAKQTRASK